MRSFIMNSARYVHLLSTVLGVTGCSAADPAASDAADESSTTSEALSGGGPANKAGGRDESVLVTLNDDTVHRLSASGKDLGVFAQAGLDNPGGITLDRFGNVYVASVNNGTIHEYTAAGADLGVFATSSEPVDLAFDHAGNLFVSDISDNSLRKFSPRGDALGSVASVSGTHCPSGLAFDRAGDLFVADQCHSVVLKVSPSGTILATISSGISNPIELAFDDGGHLFVVNSDNGGPFGNTIREFDAEGTDLGTFASDGLHFPVGLALLRTGRALVANESQRTGATDYSIRLLASDGSDLGDFVVLPSQPRHLAVVAPAKQPNCHGR